MIPYFILAVMVIIAFRLTAEFRFFTEGISRFWSIISPFLTGAVFAYILNLPCCAIQRLIEKIDNSFIRRKSRAFSVLVLIILTLLILAIILNILIPAIVSSAALFIAEFPNYEATFRGWIERLNYLDLPDFLTDHINEDALIAAVLSVVEGFNVGAIVEGIISGFGGIASAFFHTFLSIVSSIYILIEKERFKAFVIKVVAALSTRSTNEIILKYARKLDYNFHQYIYTQTIDGLILGSLMTITLLIFGNPFAVVLGVMLGIVNYIPYFGSIFGTAFAVLVVAFTQGLWPTAVVAAIVMFAIQQLDGNFIQPKLMGGKFSVSPLLIIISVTVGMHYGGVFGMLVAIPIVAVLKDILDGYIAYREENKDKPQPENDFMDKDIW